MFKTLETVCGALGIDPFAGLQILNAIDLLPVPYTPPHDPANAAWSEIQQIGPYPPDVLPFPLLPTRPALIANLNGSTIADAIGSLLRRYPADHQVTLVQENGIHQAPLGAITAHTSDTALWIYLPPLAPLADLRGPDGIAYIVNRLFGPHGCPWDREQTHQSLRTALLEESHEVLEALDAGDMRALAEELGDLLLSVLSHSEMARQAGHFDTGIVYTGIAEKLIRRHPHVFGNTSVSGSGEVLSNWELIKRAERAAKGYAPRGSLDGIPRSLPILSATQELTRKASRAGFDAPGIANAWELLREELAELEQATSIDPASSARAYAIESELGDVLLAITKLAWKLDVDAESALRGTAERFRQRFNHMEQILQEQGRTLHEMTIEEKLHLWDQTKSAQ